VTAIDPEKLSTCLQVLADVESLPPEHPDAVAAHRTAAKTLMVGDRANRDGGAAALGITTLILPSVANYTPRGLDLVLLLTANS